MRWLGIKIDAHPNRLAKVSCEGSFEIRWLFHSLFIGDPRLPPPVGSDKNFDYFFFIDIGRTTTIISRRPKSKISWGRLQPSRVFSLWLIQGEFQFASRNLCQIGPLRALLALRLHYLCANKKWVTSTSLLYVINLKLAAGHLLLMVVGRGTSQVERGTPRC